MPLPISRRPFRPKHRKEGTLRIGQVCWNAKQQQKRTGCQGVQLGQKGTTGGLNPGRPRAASKGAAAGAMHLLPKSLFPRGWLLHCGRASMSRLTLSFLSSSSAGCPAFLRVSQQSRSPLQLLERSNQTKSEGHLLLLGMVFDHLEVR